MDLIYAARYTEVCDYSFDDDKWRVATGHPEPYELPGGIWHVDTASIPEFFRRIDPKTKIRGKQTGNSQHYVVVSPSCDFGVCYQKYNHPSRDFEKWCGLQINQSIGYEDLHMGARINRNRCIETHKYSIKCWSYTEATFPIIPNNVTRWFLSNCEIEDPKVVAIPFGIFGNKDKLETANAIDSYPARKRDKLLYINFQFYNTDRARLYYHFKNNFDGYVTCKQQCPFDEFLEDLATHKFVLCPTGNGLDCYRTLETIYMGAVPILEQRMGAVEPYKQLRYPMVMYPNLFQVDPRQLSQIYDNMSSHWDGEIDLTKALWPYWRDRIKDGN